MIEVLPHVQIIDLNKGKRVLANMVTDKVYEINDLTFDIIINLKNSQLNTEELFCKLSEKYQMEKADLEKFIELLKKQKIVVES